MTNPAHITETALLLLAAYLAGCLLGYAVRLALHAGRGTRQVAPPPAADVAVPPPEQRKPRSSAARLAARVEALPPLSDAPAFSAAGPTNIAKPPEAAPGPSLAPAPPRTPAGPKPATLAEPRRGGADNLKQIKGIGPKIEASLYAMGIFHLDQIAGWSKANVEWVDAQLSFKGRIGRERWVAQAMQLSPRKTDA